MRVPVVAIIGRPNVGKSTLFNRIIKRKKAVVAPQSGVTRDRNYFLTDWNSRNFYLVDTGGLVPGAKDNISRQVKFQTEVALKEADFILFMVDAKVGEQSLDFEIARQLHQDKKNVLLIANKVDNNSQTLEIHGLNKLGLGEPWGISALSGSGVAEVLDFLADQIPRNSTVEPEEGIRVAIIGRPNVGKSSLLNSLLGQEKTIVSEMPGTTRDSIDTHIEREGESFILIDTAGLKKRAKLSDDLEYYTSLRTLRTIQECDIAALLIEGQTGIQTQDLKIAREVLEAGKGLLIIVNKWDLVEKDTATAVEYEKYIHQRAGFATFAPILFVSAKSGQRVSKLLPLVNEIYREFTKRIDTSALNDKVGAEVKRKPPPAVKGKYIKILYMTQVGIKPPEFALFSNFPQLIGDNYIRFLTQRIRDHFGFQGVPLKIKLKRKK